MGTPKRARRRSIPVHDASDGTLATYIPEEDAICVNLRIDTPIARIGTLVPDLCWVHYAEDGSVLGVTIRLVTDMLGIERATILPEVAARKDPRGVVYWREGRRYVDTGTVRIKRWPLPWLDPAPSRPATPRPELVRPLDRP